MRDDFDRIERVIDACDVVVLCRNSLYDHKVARIAALARARGRRLLFDVDDLVFDPRYAHLLMDTLAQDFEREDRWNYWFGNIGRIGATFSLCDGAIVTNEFLARHARAWSGKPVHVIPNYLNREQQEVSDSIWASKQDSAWARDGRTHLGYFSGSPSAQSRLRRRRRRHRRRDGPRPPALASHRRLPRPPAGAGAPRRAHRNASRCRISSTCSVRSARPR